MNVPELYDDSRNELLGPGTMAASCFAALEGDGRDEAVKTFRGMAADQCPLWRVGAR